jgi:beta-glucanase (GH16 family)
MIKALLMACLLGFAGRLKAQELIWSDEFDGPAGQAPSLANWGYDIGTNWGNNQLEWTTDRTENISLDGSGHLRITAREENFEGCAYTSGRIVTRGLFEPTYGRFEARIKLPVGQGIWPAFWLLGANISEVSWPQCGEIDIMEYRGQQPFINFGSAHGPGYSGGAAWTQLYTLPEGGFNDDFHVFAIEWSANRIDWMVDGIIYNTLIAGQQNGEWVFDHPFYIILNVAVGGNFVGAPNECTRFPQTMLVDWVRVWQ